jgi:hypothetical protein
MKLDVFSFSFPALTLGAVKMVLYELAAFHASSYLFIKNHPGVNAIKLFWEYSMPPLACFIEISNEVMPVMA